MAKNNGSEDKGVFDGMGPWDANGDGKVDLVDDMIIDYSMFGDEGEPEERPMKKKNRSANEKRWIAKTLISFFFGLLPTIILLIWVMSKY